MAGRRRRQQVVIWVSLLVVAGGLTLIFSPTQAAVALVYFQAVSREQAVELQWETATEIDNAGFFITRSDQITGIYTQVSEFIFTQSPDGLSGATYVYTDTNLTNGVTYWYKLESVDINQNVNYSEVVYSIPGETQATPVVAAARSETDSQTSTTVPPTTTTLPCASAAILLVFIILLGKFVILS